MGKKNQKGSDANVAGTSSGITGKINEFREFFEESQVEMKKVVFPSRKETTATTMAVVALVVVMSIFLYLVDFGLSNLVSLILA